MTRDDAALQIFAAMLAGGGELSAADFGERQVRTAFALADTFTKVAAETPPADDNAARRPRTSSSDND